MPRIRFIVCYDISDDKRLRRVARVLEGYGVRLQFSVFECPLDNLRLQELKAALAQAIHQNDDQVLFIELGPASKTVSIESMGRPYTQRTRLTIV